MFCRYLFIVFTLKQLLNPLLKFYLKMHDATVEASFISKDTYSAVSSFLLEQFICGAVFDKTEIISNIFIYLTINIVNVYIAPLSTKLLESNKY